MAKFPIEVTAVDKTRPTMDQLVKRWEGWNKTAEKTVKPVQLIEKSLDRILKPFGFERFAKNFGQLGEASGLVAGGLGDLAGGVGGLGEAAAAAAGPLTIVVAAAGAAGGAIVATANKYNQAGASLDYFSQQTEMSVGNIQKWIIAAGRMQVSSDEAKAALLGVHDTLATIYMKPKAYQILNQAHLTPPKPGEPIDENAWLLRIADIIHNHAPTPGVKKQVADEFGIPRSMIPFLDQDPKVLKQRLDAIEKTNPYTKRQADAAKARDQQFHALTDTAGGLMKSLGEAASDAAAPFVHPLTRVLQGATQAVEGVKRRGLALPATAAAVLFPMLAVPALLAAGTTKAVVDAAKRRIGAARPVAPGGAQISVKPQMERLEAMRARGLGDAPFDRFAARIERQESGGRQFRRPGQPLTSPKGAVGAMQVLPSTAADTARRHGIDFDATRLAFDKAYNEMLGKLHLQDLLGHFGGSQTLAAAAYNAGEKVVDDWLYGTNLSGKNPRARRLADPRLGAAQDAAFRAGIPGRGPGSYAETRNYVASTVPPPIEINVRFANAPPGTVAEAKAGGGAKINLHIGHAMAQPG